jgi:hypothetical protein
MRIHKKFFLLLFICEKIETASLHVGRVRDLGLDVIQDKPNHAEIIKLAYRIGKMIYQVQKG